MKDILIVIDMQKDFISGALANKDAEGILPALGEKIRGFVRGWRRKNTWRHFP